MGLLPLLMDEDTQALELPAEAANAIVARGIWLYRRVLPDVPLGDSQPGIAPLSAPEDAAKGAFRCAANHIGSSQIIAYIPLKYT